MSELVSEEEMASKHAKYENRLAKSEHMKTMSASALVASKKPSRKEIVFRDISDEELRHGLSDYTVDDVNHVLDSIIADKSVDKKARRQAVARIVKNQPHPTKEFASYDRENDELMWHPGVVEKGLLSLAACVALFFLCAGIVFPSLVGDQWNPSLLIPLVMFYSIPAAFVAAFIGDASHRMPHKEAYGVRETMSNQEVNGKLRITPLAPEPVESNAFSVAQVKHDFAEAKARIASYETDFDKALKFPAFNNIAVPETKEMIKQLRACRKMEENLNETTVEKFSAEVDELWVRIQTAEEAARDLSLSSLSQEEVVLFEQAKNLFAHASDLSYSDEVRTNFYQKLKSVVDKLNTGRRLVPTKIVAEIEPKAALRIETTKEEERSYV